MSEKVSYEQARNELIEFAERRADQYSGKEPHRKNYDNKHTFEKDHRVYLDTWNRHFHREMNSLCFEMLQNNDGSYKEHIT